MIDLDIPQENFLMYNTLQSIIDMYPLQVLSAAYCILRVCIHIV